MIQDAIIKILGGFLTAYGILAVQNFATGKIGFGWVIFLLTFGLALLFLPKTEK
ncbi:MAG: hypothetical protein AABW57_01990 [Nanoarchaeota archaeon]